MEFSFIRTAEELHALGPEWNRILESSPGHAPFLRHEYQEIWWSTRGGGEWPQAELATVVARENGAIAGIAPLFSTLNKEGEAALMLLGSVEISDYLDILAFPDKLETFIDGLLPFLSSQDTPAWKLLDWYNILETSATLPALQAAAQRLGWKYDTECCSHSPYIPIPGDWEAYLAAIDKKQRHEIRRKMRRVESAEVPTRWYILDDPARLEADSQAFLDLMAMDAEKAAFLTPPMRTQMLNVMRCAFEDGCLQLAFLEVDGKKAAGYYNFDYQNRIWVYNSGLDPSLGEYSPGWVLLGYLLQWANENKRSEFDFMRGREDYKYRFGAVDRFVMRARVTR